MKLKLAVGTACALVVLIVVLGGVANEHSSVGLLHDRWFGVVVPTGPRPNVSSVLVTGGAGFIGSSTAARLLLRGDRVIVVDEMNDYYDVKKKWKNVANLRSIAAPGMFMFYEGDICDSELMRDIFRLERPQVVCHMAARAGVRPSIMDPFVYVHSNILGTITLLDLAKSYPITNFVYASSSSVYGESMAEEFFESDPVHSPLSPYGATKVSTEVLATTYHNLYNISVTGLRFFTVYGPNGRPDMAPYKFVDRIFKGLPIDIYGNWSTSYRDYTFIDDIVDGVIRAIDKPLGNAVVNLGRGHTILLSSLVSVIEELLGKKAIVRQLPHQMGDVSRTHASVEAAKSLLGYSPKTDLPEGMRITVNWYLREVAGMAGREYSATT